MATQKALVVVESPTKARTLSRLLRRSYEVKASMGHVKDLPKSQLGINVAENFAPRYIVIKGKGPIIKELKEAARRASAIYMATDPDREGEAISWHLAELLSPVNPEIRRIEFHEITKEAVQRALKHPREINQHLVDAQQARRGLDRLVGYTLSPLLWRKVRGGLSAGRVQSVALRLVVDREREIEAFTPQEYWSITAVFQTADGKTVPARLVARDGARIGTPAEDGATVIRTEAEARALVEEIRAQGYAVNDEESTLMVRSVGAPIFNAQGRPIAGIGVSGPAFRMTPERLQSIVPSLKDAAAKLSAQFGYVVQHGAPDAQEAERNGQPSSSGAATSA